MATELIGTARQEANKETVKRHPRLARASATLAVAAGGLAANADVRGDEAGRVHATPAKAGQEPPPLGGLCQRGAGGGTPRHHRRAILGGGGGVAGEPEEHHPPT